MQNNLGAIYTPTEFARFLVKWAIQNPRDTVLDMGIGEGAFVFAAYERLLELGCNDDDALRSIYGSEINDIIYHKFIALANEKNFNFPHLHQSDFFALDFPEVDAVVGNPPYVRRKHIKDLDIIRESVIKINSEVRDDELRHLTDLYVYFLLRALPRLKKGGRLAVLLADSWLNVGYGRVLKKYLKENFEISQLISLDRRVFDDAQVKPVLLLAIKGKQTNADYFASFIRVKNGLPIGAIQEIRTQRHLDDIVIKDIPVRKLNVEYPWGIYFKAPDIYEFVAGHELMTPIAHIANTQIGIQTLAKEFFVLTPEQAEKHGIEEEFLAPLAQSARYFHKPTIEDNDPIPFLVFYCSNDKADLEGTNALKYILVGESTEVIVRGKNKTVTGYQQKERIQKANRRNWYDLKTEIERRGRASILIPRLVYSTFMVVWNEAKFVPGELFIEFMPLEPEAELEAYLAILNSSLMEVMFRSYAQVYGGGTYNINPGQIRRVPMLNVAQLTTEQKLKLAGAYRGYLSAPVLERQSIDKVVGEILGFGQGLQDNLRHALADLRLIATSAKKSALHP